MTYYTEFSLENAHINIHWQRQNVYINMDKAWWTDRLVSVLQKYSHSTKQKQLQTQYDCDCLPKDILVQTALQMVVLNESHM